MDQQATQSGRRRTAKDRRRRACVRTAIMVAAAGAVVLFSDGATEAARLTATAVAKILRATSSISATSNFEVGLPSVIDSEVVIDVDAGDGDESRARLSKALKNVKFVSQPATFLVSGIPNQAYSVSVPTGRTTTAGAFGADPKTVLVFSDFSHDAGITPSIGASGSAAFAVGARVTLEPAGGAVKQSGNGSENPNAVPTANILSPLEANSSGPLATFGANGGELSQAVRSSDPFSFSLDPRFLNVLVSYN